jgi:hypothetical protein
LVLGLLFAGPGPIRTTAPPAEILRFPYPGQAAVPPGLEGGIAPSLVEGRVVVGEWSHLILAEEPQKDEVEPGAQDGIAYYSWAVGLQAGYPASTGIDEVLLGSAPRHRGDVYTGLSLIHQCRPFDLAGVGLRFELEIDQTAILESARDKKPYWQTNAFFSMRYLGEELPWSRRVATSVAISEGASYNWKVSDVELARNGKDDVGKLLNFLMLDISARKARSRYSVYFRIAHRSGGAGYLAEGDVIHGSNALLLGLRIDLGRPIADSRGDGPSW